MKLTSRLLTLAATLAFAITPALHSQAAVTLDFQSLEHVDINLITHGLVYEEDGFRIDDALAVSVFATFGTLEARYTGSTALLNNTIGGVTRLSKVGGGTFTLTSIDLAELNGSNVALVTFVGTHPGGATEVQVFALDGVAFGAQTFTFPPSFTNLEKVEWSQDSPFHQFDNIVLDGLLALDPTHTALYTKGEVLPTAGVDPYIPAGATWFGFGIPAVDEGGHVAVVARWKNPAGSASTYGSGLFVDGALKVYLGQAVPGIVDTTFKKFRDPVISGQHLALVATIEGTGVLPTNDTVVIRVRPTGEVTVLAREGAAAEGAGGSVFKAFKSVNIAGGFLPVGPTGILYTATLDKVAGVPPATSADDYGAWLFRNDVTTLAVREGGAATGLGVGETVKTFTLLKTASGTPGQGRGQLEPELVSFTAKTSTGRSVLLRYDTGVLTAFAAAGDVLGGTTLALAQWKSFGLLSESSVALAQRGVLENNVGGVTGSAAKGIFLGNPAGNAWEPVVQVGGATGITDVTFKSLKDPALAADSAAVAFPAALEGTGVLATNDASLWWQPDGGALTMLAREGAEPPETSAGVQWKAFTSLAIPGGATGPLFLATLVKGAGGVDATNDAGVWGTTSAGTLRLLFREGNTVVGKTVKALAVLKAVSGSPGSAHAFNSSAQVVWRAAFTDGTTAIVKTHVP